MRLTFCVIADILHSVFRWPINVKRPCKGTTGTSKKIQVSLSELNRVTQAKVISMRYRLFIFHKSLSKRAQYFGISVPRKKMSQRIAYEPRQRVRKKFGNIIKSRWIIAAHPRRTLWSSGCEGMVAARPLVIFGGQPVFKYEPVVRVRGA